MHSHGNKAIDPFETIQKKVMHMRSLKLVALMTSLMFAMTVQANEKKGKAIGEIAPGDIAPTDQKWEFASEDWCWYAAKLGVKMLKDANLDLSKYEWGFSEEYTHTPERLMAGRDLAGYYFMIKDGKTEWGVPILTKMTDQQKLEFYKLIGR